jgi:hypothetical protein
MVRGAVVLIEVLVETSANRASQLRSFQNFLDGIRDLHICTYVVVRSDEKPAAGVAQSFPGFFLGQLLR